MANDTTCDPMACNGCPNCVPSGAGRPYTPEELQKPLSHALVYVKPGYAYAVLRWKTFEMAAVCPTYWDALKYQLFHPLTRYQIRLIYFSGAWMSSNAATEESAHDFMTSVNNAGVAASLIRRTSEDLLRQTANDKAFKQDSNEKLHKPTSST